MPNRSDLIEAWLRYNADEREGADDTDPDWWAVDELMNLIGEEPDEAWNLMCDVARASSTEWQLVMVGCGTMESLLMVNPERYMTALEEAAPTNRNLVVAAARTWLHNEPVRLRVDALLRQYDQPRL